VIVLHFNYSAFNPLSVGQDFLNAAKESYKKNKTLNGYTEKVLLYQPYKRPVGEKAPKYPVPVNILASVLAKGDGTFKALTEIKGESQEALEARGFKFGPRADFIPYRLSSTGEWFAIPKYQVFQKSGVAIPNYDPNNLRLNPSEEHPIYVNVMTEAGTLAEHNPVRLTGVQTDGSGNKTYVGTNSEGKSVTFAAPRVDYGLNWMFKVIDNAPVDPETSKEDSIEEPKQEAPKAAVTEKPKDTELSDNEKIVQEAQNTPEYWEVISPICRTRLSKEDVQYLKSVADRLEISVNSWDFAIMCRIAAGVAKKSGNIHDVFPDLDTISITEEQYDALSATELHKYNVEYAKYMILFNENSNDGPLGAVTVYKVLDPKRPGDGISYYAETEPEEIFNCTTEQEDEVWQICSDSLIGTLPF